jgi:hypothetical protein
MNYQKFVFNQEKVFAEKLKVASDLAKILDNPLFKINLKGDERPDEDVLEGREIVFGIFSNFCKSCDGKIPPYEKNFYKFFLPKKEEAGEKELEKVMALRNDIKSRLKGVKKYPATIIRSIADLMVMFSSEREITKKNMMAMINDALDKFGMDLIKKDFADYSMNFPIGRSGPKELTKVVIFDDCKEELMNTARRLAGWPNVDFVCLHYKGKYFSDSDTKNKEEELKKAAKSILKNSPKIVLMDQGLFSIEGSDVVRKIKEINLTSGIVFVANTGGSSDELNKAGAIGNLEKGRNLGSLERAIYMLQP